MPLATVPQPEIIPIREDLRLRKYDGNYALLLPGYQDPYVCRNSEGIFDDAKKPDLAYVKGMCEYLDAHGELYYIETLENGAFLPIGDVTVKAENPPIAIWFERFRGRGIGTAVMKAMIDRLRMLGFSKITGSTVYRWNDVSLRMHLSLGFSVISSNKEEHTLELEL